MTRVIGLIILYVVCFAIIVASVFCGIQLYKEVKAESYVNGSIDISNKFSLESFKFSEPKGITFYKDDYDDTDTYYFDKYLLKTENFDGKAKTYNVLLNNFILLNTDINAGSIFATFNVDFYDTDGNVTHSADMNISIKFLSDKTQLRLSTKGNENAKFLEQYFSDYGIKLQVKEILQQGGSVN